MRTALGKQTSKALGGGWQAGAWRLAAVGGANEGRWQACARGWVRVTPRLRSVLFVPSSPQLLVITLLYPEPHRIVCVCVCVCLVHYVL